ncbi:MAG: guanosine monophosphate reductase [candidate division WOR-3 bacterium]|nr:MAG: guanosine monophosphate reductase [candidate division WOR-3 bacterium]
MMNFETHITFDDVLLVPQYSDIKSRSEVTLTSELSEGMELRVPIISAPMDTVCGRLMATRLAEFGALGIVHRYNTIETQTTIVAEASDGGLKNVGAAIGITGDYIERAAALIDAGATTLCLDVAHGDHVLMHVGAHNIIDKFGDKAHIMAGNIATYTGALALAQLGVDSIRVGIGGGSICSTRIQTGHGMPTLASVFECVQVKEKFPDLKIVADGGIKTSGDMVKALAAGADFVMVGSLLAGTAEAPGEIVYKDGEKYKSYRGMASKDAQMDWRGKTSSLEGVATVIPYKGQVFPVLSGLENGIRSGLSYSGARNLQELRENARFIRQTASGLAESNTHIMWRY